MKEQIIYGRNAVLEGLSLGTVHKVYMKKGIRDGSMKKIYGRARDLGVVVAEVSKEKLDEMAEGNNHQGVCAYTSDFSYTPLEVLLEKLPKNPFLVLLDGIEDPHNLGAIIRSAHQGGADGVIIPKRRAVGVTGTVYKTSAGAVVHIPVVQVTNMSQTVETLKEKGFWVYGGDMGETPFYKTDFTGAVALVIGGEGKGLSPGLKKHLDGIVSIPMVGKLDSINASCAASILIFEVLRQRYEKA